VCSSDLDNLKKQYREVDLEAETGAKVSIQLRGHELNGLYQALLNVEGSGIENARRFIKMLTSVGEAVTTAMKELGEMNKQITELHQQLSVLDAEIDQAQAATEAVTPELITDETEK
jgi:type I site-specific restriction endonuclease